MPVAVRRPDADSLELARGARSLRSRSRSCAASTVPAAGERVRRHARPGPSRNGTSAGPTLPLLGPARRARRSRAPTGRERGNQLGHRGLDHERRSPAASRPPGTPAAANRSATRRRRGRCRRAPDALHARRPSRMSNRSRCSSGTSSSKRACRSAKLGARGDHVRDGRGRGRCTRTAGAGRGRSRRRCTARSRGVSRAARTSAMPSTTRSRATATSMPNSPHSAR